MPSNLDLLRQGESIEFEPGVTGRLNSNKKTLELSTGEILDASRHKGFFPETPQEQNLALQREATEKSAKGTVGKFLHQLTSHGVLSAPGDWRAFLTQTGEQYANTKAAQAQTSKRISQESPVLSGTALAASFVPDIALTRGMSAMKAAPLLTGISAGSRIATEPAQVAGEAALSAAGGKILDVGANWASKAASRRAASRAMPGQQAAVKEANMLQEQQHDLLTSNVKASNAQILKDHERVLLDRKNAILQNKNDYAQKQAAREAEVLRLKNQYDTDKMARSANVAKSEAEYKAALKTAQDENKRMAESFKLEESQYAEAQKRLPELQKKAQAEHSANVVENAKKIEGSFPKNSRIDTTSLDTSSFIDQGINKTGLAGTREAAQASRTLKALFPDGELLSAKELASRYKALEDAIQRSSPEVQKVLTEFKSHLGKRIPAIAGDTIAHAKVVPLLTKKIGDEVKAVVKELGLDASETVRLSNYLSANAKAAIKNDLTPANFLEQLQSGDLTRNLATKIGTPEEFVIQLSAKEKAYMMKNLNYTEETLNNAFISQGLEKQRYFVDNLAKRLDKIVGKTEAKALQAAQKASKQLKADIKGTYGMAEPVAPPNAPMAPEARAIPQPPQAIPEVVPPQMPPTVAPPMEPPIPAPPAQAQLPQAPVPQPIPQLPPAQGMAEQAGDFFEKNLLGGKGLVNNPMTKLAGLKYLLGGAAMPAEAAYLGGKLLTSPTAAGQVARMTFKQGGIQAIESWAQQLPSYNNGILESPQDRRMLTKQIEEAYDIPVEQKAILQSKVNRGRPLNGPL